MLKFKTRPNYVNIIQTKIYCYLNSEVKLKHISKGKWKKMIYVAADKETCPRG